MSLQRLARPPLWEETMQHMGPRLISIWDTDTSSSGKPDPSTHSV